MYTFVDFTSQIVGWRRVPCPTNKGVSYTNLVCWLGRDLKNRLLLLLLIKNSTPNMDKISSWKWVPKRCELPQIDPHWFLKFVRNMNNGFVGDSLNENMLVSFL
jgi:hypothetical protein